MSNKIAGENTIQAVINETKKLTRPEVAVGNTMPLDKNIQLFVKEDEEGASPNDFYTKAEVDKLIEELTTKLTKAADLRSSVIRRMTSGYVEDPYDFNNTPQSRTIPMNSDWEGTLIIQCRVETNPEACVFTTFCLGGYLFNIDHLAGNSTSSYIKVSGASSENLTITNLQYGCGRLYYDIILIPFKKTE